MKLILSLTAVFSLFANLALAAPPSVHARVSNCPDSRHALSFLRVDKDQADHFYSTDPQEIKPFIKNSGYTANGAVGGIFPTRESGTTPLYRLYNTVLDDYIYTSDVAEKTKLLGQGYGGQVIAGYVLQSDSCKFRVYKALPLHRFYSSKETAHLLTTDVHGQPAGYVVDGKVVGYVLV